VKIQSPSGADVPVEVKDNDDGTYNCTYTPNEPGRHKLGVGLKGRPVLANHFIPVDKSKTDALKSTAYGPGLETGNVINKPTHFTIQARNRIGDPMKTGGDPFKVEIIGPHNSLVDHEMADANDGKYEVTYEPTVPGDHLISITLNTIHIVKSPFTVFVARSDDDPDPSQFDVEGRGIEGGDTADPCIFTVIAKNTAGQRILHGGHAVDTEVTGPSEKEVASTVKDNDDGTYTVVYQPVDPGKHRVDVVLRTKLTLFYDHIRDSPYFVPIIAGTDAGASQVWGPGLEDVYDTKPATFYIKSCDRDGNPMGRGGDPYVVKITGPNGEVPAEIVDKGDGTYDVTYAPPDHGLHRIEVTLRNKQVAKSPYSVMVKEGASHEFSTIERFQFTIRSRTKAGKDKPIGGEIFSVDISGPTAVEDVVVKDLSDGRYLCDYSLPEPGAYQIHVKINNHDIKGSPFSQTF